MTDRTSETFFLPAERSPREVIERQHQLLSCQACAQVLNAIPNPVLILNTKRQIVYANRSFMELLGTPGPGPFLGLRPGEALRCIHSGREKGGCGTTEFCTQCGGAHSIMKGLAGTANTAECRIQRRLADREEALDLLVASTPLTVENEKFLVYSLTDVSSEFRRRALERIFFHDILNTAGGLRGLSEVLAEEVPEHLKENAETLHISSSQLVDEIVAQKELLAAECNELKTQTISLRPGELLAVMARTFEGQPLAGGRRIVTEDRCGSIVVESDFTLLRRIIGNMLKNALEASAPGDTVTMRSDCRDGRVLFSVHNPGHIPREVQLQIFNRSFSTKGKGRGLGTYGMRLLAERYLAGRVHFETSPGAGTTFIASFPLTLAPGADNNS